MTRDWEMARSVHPILKRDGVKLEFVTKDAGDIGRWCVTLAPGSQSSADYAAIHRAVAALNDDLLGDIASGKVGVPFSALGMVDTNPLFNSKPGVYDFGPRSLDEAFTEHNLTPAPSISSRISSIICRMDAMRTELLQLKAAL